MRLVFTGFSQRGQFVPGDCLVASCATIHQIFIIMKVEVTVHLDGFDYTGTGEVIRIVAAASERKVRAGRIDGASEGGIGAKTQRRI